MKERNSFGKINCFKIRIVCEKQFISENNYYLSLRESENGNCFENNLEKEFIFESRAGKLINERILL